MSENKSQSKLLKELGSLTWTVWIIVGMIVIMAYATYVESQEGHEAAMAKGFHSLPMDLLIAALAVNVTACTIGRAPYRVHQIPWLVLHLGLLLTMAGTIISHRTSMVGQIVLRVGQPVSAATIFGIAPTPMEAPLGFTLHLDSFEAKFYPGTGKASDYISKIRMYDQEKGIADTVIVRVNHPIVHRGWNISQSSFFPGDNQATILGANKDPGTPVSYSGFLTIFLGLAGIFFLKPWLKQKFPPLPKVKKE
jgi:hypothetical protein